MCEWDTVISAIEITVSGEGLDGSRTLSRQSTRSGCVYEIARAHERKSDRVRESKRQNEYNLVMINKSTVYLKHLTG